MVEATSSFWQLTFQEHGTAVMAFLTSRLGRRDLAEDLLQETFVRAIRAGGALRDRSKVRTYLFTIAHRLILDQRRRRQPVLFSQFSPEDEETLQEIGDPGSPSPEEAAVRWLVLQRLQESVADLPPALRTAFQMAIFEQRSYAEIAQDQGWSPGQVRVNVCRARKAVIASLKDDLETERESEP